MQTMRSKGRNSKLLLGIQYFGKAYLTALDLDTLSEGLQIKQVNTNRQSTVKPTLDKI